ncbi:hypothetical protein BJ165DRAFT_1599375 [Panaeolus papilionaceus]|nr:hypothetical protein BJ165DRAFT_1599375 [Panaeolus papilionaceus]
MRPTLRISVCTALKIYAIRWPAATSSGLQLNRCLTKTLRKLYLYCYSCGPSLKLFPVANLCSALSNIKHSSALEKVHIFLMRQSMGNVAEWMEAWLQDWRVFDDLLAGNSDSNFQKLQKVEVEFYGSEDLVDTFWSRALVELHTSFTFSFERSHVFPSYTLTFLRRTT